MSTAYSQGRQDSRLPCFCPLRQKQNCPVMYFSLKREGQAGHLLDLARRERDRRKTFLEKPTGFWEAGPTNQVARRSFFEHLDLRPPQEPHMLRIVSEARGLAWHAHVVQQLAQMLRNMLRSCPMLPHSYWTKKPKNKNTLSPHCWKVVSLVCCYCF